MDAMGVGMKGDWVKEKREKKREKREEKKAKKKRKESVKYEDFVTF